MQTKPRPADSCVPVVSIAPLPEAERDRLVGVFKALADANRLEILRLITAQPAPICVCDIVACFDLSQPTISHHLKVLRKAGLVSATRRGVWAYYTATPGFRSLVPGLSLGPLDRRAETRDQRPNLEAS